MVLCTVGRQLGRLEYIPAWQFCPEPKSALKPEVFLSKLHHSAKKTILHIILWPLEAVDLGWGSPRLH